jgi:hypothetical protein
MALLSDDWNYESSPDKIPRDHVRELVGDVDKNEKLVTDTTIALALESQSNNARLAAAKVAEKIAALFAKEATSKSGKDYSRTMNRSDAFFKLADRLRTQDPNTVGGAAQTRVSSSQALYGNSDIRRGAFRTGMFTPREFDPRTELRDQDVLDDVRYGEEVD